MTTTDWPTTPIAVSTPADNFIPADYFTIYQQIGRANVLAISGGPWIIRDTGITLPVRYGYKVTIDLAADDTYTVRRIFVRYPKAWIKREWTQVYADEVGEIAYQASCYLDH